MDHHLSLAKSKASSETPGKLIDNFSSVIDLTQQIIQGEIKELVKDKDSRAVDEMYIKNWESIFEIIIKLLQLFVFDKNESKKQKVSVLSTFHKEFFNLAPVGSDNRDKLVGI